MRWVKSMLSVAAVLWPAVALAAAGLAPLPQPDPKTRNMTPAQVQQRTYESCLVVQARIQQTPREEVMAGCRCYASGTVKAMSRADLQSFRETSVFNDATRAVALEQIDRCKLRRPV
jgi:predicted metal-binding protein